MTKVAFGYVGLFLDENGGKINNLSSTNGQLVAGFIEERSPSIKSVQFRQRSAFVIPLDDVVYVKISTPTLFHVTPKIVSKTQQSLNVHLLSDTNLCKIRRVPFLLTAKIRSIPSTCTINSCNNYEIINK